MNHSQHACVTRWYWARISANRLVATALAALFSVSVFAQGTTPDIISPADGSTLSGSVETFTWSANDAAVDKWLLRVGTSPGGSDLLYNHMNASVLDLEVPGLPTDGRDIYVRLAWSVDGEVLSVDYLYTALNTLACPAPAWTLDPPPP